jgi:hypothetical protein
MYRVIIQDTISSLQKECVREEEVGVEEKAAMFVLRACPYAKTVLYK